MASSHGRGASEDAKGPAALKYVQHTVRQRAKVQPFVTSRSFSCVRSEKRLQSRKIAFGHNVLAAEILIRGGASKGWTRRAKPQVEMTACG